MLVAGFVGDQFVLGEPFEISGLRQTFLPTLQSGNQMRRIRAGADRRSALDFAPAIALLVVSALGIFAAALSPTGDGGQYLVIAPFGYDLVQTVELVGAAGGDIVDLGDLANVVIVHSENPRFVRALYRAGAWLVIDPMRLGGCLGFGRTPAPAPGGA